MVLLHDRLTFGRVAAFTSTQAANKAAAASVRVFMLEIPMLVAQQLVGVPVMCLSAARVSRHEEPTLSKDPRGGV